VDFPPPQTRTTVPPTIGLETVAANNADEAFSLTLRSVLQHGHDVRGLPDPDGRDDDPKSFREITGFQLKLLDPLDRIALSRGFKIVPAIARFVWMASGNERLEDIAFYEPKVQGFTDDGLIVPGSNYGKRIRAPEPGVDQLGGVVKRLRLNPDTRRAALVIWHSQDAVRDTNDLPCAFGMSFSVRGKQLIAITSMRSNNAFTLLPFNLFEFGLVSEVVAAELDLELGPALHSANSMHVFDEHRQIAEASLASYDSLDQPRPIMEPMPRNPRPLAQIGRLAQIEARIRHDAAGLSNAPLEQLVAADAALHPYWQSFGRVLLAHALCRVARYADALSLAGMIPGYFGESTRSHVESMMTGKEAAAKGQLHLIPEEKESVQLSVSDAYALSDQEVAAASARLEEICAELDVAVPVTVPEFRSLRQRLIIDRRPIAAREDAGPVERGNRPHFSAEEVEQELRAIRDAAN
jgi:hypothetical protein